MIALASARPLAFLTALCALALGCAPDAAHEPAFRADPDLGAPSLRLVVEPSSGGAHAQIVGRDLGPVFGLAAQLRFDPEVLTVAVPSNAETALAAALSGEPADVRSLVAMREDVASFGATHVVPGSESTLAGETVLLELDLHAVRGGASRLALERVAVRRADGSYVDVEALGGELVLAEVAR